MREFYAEEIKRINYLKPIGRIPRTNLLATSRLKRLVCRAARRRVPISCRRPSCSTKLRRRSPGLDCGRSCRQVRCCHQWTWSHRWIHVSEVTGLTSVDTSCRSQWNASFRGMYALNAPTCTLQRQSNCHAYRLYAACVDVSYLLIPASAAW